MNFTTYLTDSDYYTYYPAMDMTSYDNEELVNLLFPDSYYYFLQDFEIAYMDGQESVSGYIPYLVEKEYLDDLSYVIPVSYTHLDVYKRQSLTLTSSSRPFTTA